MSRVTIDSSDLQGLSRLIDTNLLEVELAHIVLAEAKAEAPRLTGRLQRSGKLVIQDGKVSIVFDAARPGQEPYAAFVHDGTRFRPARRFTVGPLQRLESDLDGRVEAIARRIYLGQ